MRRTLGYSPKGAPKRKGDLVIPSQHRRTILLLVHGGEGTAGSRASARAWADFYAQHGYPSFAIDYFLSNDQTPPPVYPKPERDVKAAVQYLRKRAVQIGIDPDQIVVQGFSAGAALGAQALVTPDAPFFAGAGHYPDLSDKPAGFIGFYGRYDGGQRDPRRYYGDQSRSTDRVVDPRAQANSIGHAADASGPALLFQGDADRPVLVQQVNALADALQHVGKDVTLIDVSGAAHNFDRAGGRLTPAGEKAAQQILDWLEARFPAR